MNKWNYVSETKKSSGYDEYMDYLKSCTHDKYISLSDEEKDKLIDDIFNVYRSKNIFPITYFNDEGIKEEIQKCNDKHVEFNDGTLDLKYNQGSALGKFMFPNLFKVQCKNDKNNSMIERFNNDHKLKRAIKLSLDIKANVTPSNIFGALQLIGGSTASGFKCMTAKALYEKYVPKGGIIHDNCAGFGNRMLGALSSKNNYTYIATEVNSDTVESLNRLGGYIEQVTGRENSFKIIKQGSEDFKLSKPYFDFSFTSLPYFTLERYSDEETQSVVKFPELDSWLEGYIRPTFENTYFMLKPNCRYAINIADFNVGKTRVEFVDECIKIAKEVGFEYETTIAMKIQSRTGVGNADNSVRKQEGVYVFKKI